MNNSHPKDKLPNISLLSIIVPARNEDSCIQETLLLLYQHLAQKAVPHEIIVIDDGSSDQTWVILQKLTNEIPVLRLFQNLSSHGFGRAVVCGINHMKGDAVVICMADGSDNPQDVEKYFNLLNQGYECVFGSRFISGGKVVDYPLIKLYLNRAANLFIKLLFNINLNDTTNAFKAYRRYVIDGCHPILSPHFNLTIELPLKAIIRGFTWTVVPVSWTNRKSGESKLKIKEMGSRYFFICMYIWLEKYFSKGDYRR